MRFFVFFLFMSLLPAFGELSPAVYEQKQNSASEHLQLRIIHVAASAEQIPSVTEVRALAVVTDVTRTASKIKIGDTLEILYSITAHPQRWCGPGEIPLLKDDECTVAYLNKSAEEDFYVPAAGVMSFREF